MKYQIILSAFAVMTLIMCKNQKMSDSKDKETKVEVEQNTTAQSVKSTTSSQNSGEPEMSVGLPPDREAQKIAASEQANAGNSTTRMLYLKEGVTQTLKDQKMRITFKRMKEDSRCPQDVNCVWAGVATAEIELLGSSNRPLTILLSTMDDSNKSYQKTTNFDGYNYTLTEVSPETTSDKGFNSLKGSYKIGVKIEKGTSENTILQRN